MARAKAKLGAFFKAMVERAGGSRQRFLAETHWHWECFDKDGNLKWEEKNKNVCTDQGLNALIDIMFHAATQIATWYCAIFETNHTPVAGDTYAAPGYTECTAYDESVRPEFVEAAASGKVTTNAANRAVFTMNAGKTIYGGALVGGGSAGSTKGDTAGGGKLYAASLFSSPKVVVATDVLRLTISITAADV